MNKLLVSLGGVGSASTANGAKSYNGTGDANLDLFSKIGSARNMDKATLLTLFDKACKENVDLATRIVLWARDARGGAGERKTFRTILSEIDKVLAGTGNEALVQRLVDLTVELGRWDDLFAIEYHFDLVAKKFASGIKAGDALCLKWLPREKSANKAIAFKLMKALDLTPKQYRKVCAGVVTTETLMCARLFNEINLSQVPSVASARYQKAFAKNHPGYAAWKEALVKGEVKVNASVSFPHDVLRSYRAGTDVGVVQAIWDALPNYIPEGVNVLPISDVSGSMTASAGGSLSCLDVSISLGAYLATKNTGAFKNALITFADKPEFHWMAGNIGEEFGRIENMDWGGSTNFQATFDLILNHAKSVKAEQKDMPDMLVCLSDMQFNMTDKGTNFDAIAEKYKQAGYKMPRLVFWNLNAAYKDSPATKYHENVALVSGFSPAILKATLAGETITPLEVMMDTVMVDRYKLI